MVWTRFRDMHSGGRAKEPYEYIYIEAPKDKAVEIFEATFGHHPFWIECECCGENYVVDEYESLERASAYERGCKPIYVDDKGNRFKSYKSGLTLIYLEESCDYGKYISMEDFLKNKDFLAIYAES